MASVFDIILQAPAPASGSNQFNISLAAKKKTVFILWIQDEGDTIITGS